MSITIDLSAAGGLQSSLITAFTEGTPVLIAPTASVDTFGQIDTGSTIDSMSLVLAGAAATERLSLDPVGAALAAAAGIAVHYTAATGTLQMTRSNQSSALWSALLSHVLYSNSSLDPRAFASIGITVKNTTLFGGSASATVLLHGTLVNDAPTLVAKASNPTFTEAAGFGTQAAAVRLFADAHATAVEAGQAITRLSLTVTGLVDGANERLLVDGTTIALGASGSGTTATNAMSYAVMVAGGTATVVLFKDEGVAPSAINTLVDHIAYQNGNADAPTPGDRTVTLTGIQDTGGAANGGADSTRLEIGSTVTVAALYDAPTLSAKPVLVDWQEAYGGTHIFSGPILLFKDANTHINEPGGTIDSLTLTIDKVGDPLEYLGFDNGLARLNVASSGTAGSSGIHYVVTVENGTATVVLSKAGGFTASAMNDLVNGLTFGIQTATDPNPGLRRVVLTQLQGSGGSSGGHVTTPLSIPTAFHVRAVSDEPTLTIHALNPHFIEASGFGNQAAPVAMFSNANASAVEARETITDVNIIIYNMADGMNEMVVLDGTTISLGADSSGKTANHGVDYLVRNYGRNAWIDLYPRGFPMSVVNDVLNSIAYQNTSDNPTAGGRIFTINRITDNGARGPVGDGDASTDLSIQSVVTVQRTSDAPTLSATAVNPSFVEASGVGTQAAPVTLFSGTQASAVDWGQYIKRLAFTVAGLVDGASEVIMVDGTAIALGAGSSGTTLINSMHYKVTIVAGTATVTLTSTEGVAAQAIDAIVNGIAYENTRTDLPTAGARTFTLTEIHDSGGTANGGGDTTILSISSTVTVLPVNDAPTTAPVTLATTPLGGGARLITQAELLVNAHDVEGDVLRASDLTISGGGGSLVDNGEGTWSYTPPPGNDQVVSFSYSISDGTTSVAATAHLEEVTLTIPDTAINAAERTAVAFTVSVLDDDAASAVVTFTDSHGRSVHVEASAGVADLGTLAGGTVTSRVDVVDHSGNTLSAVGDLITLDAVNGSDGDDLILGTAGNNTFNGLGGDDVIRGMAGIDHLNGGAGDDRLDGGAGADHLSGGTGNDVYLVDDVHDQVIEGRHHGVDTVETSVSWAMAAGQEIETLRAIGSGAVLGVALTGNEFANSLIGGLGKDTLGGGDGDDRLDGRGGADRMQGGAGNDVYLVDDAHDQVVEAIGDGIDTVEASVSWAMMAGQEIETLRAIGAGATAGVSLRGNELANAIRGGAGIDTLHGGAGDDHLDGVGGADRMYGDAGNDFYVVDDVHDQVFEQKGKGSDTVEASVSWTMMAGQSIETLRAVGSGAIDGVSFSGNELANALYGGAGIDTLHGEAGKDWLDGGRDADLMYGGAGDDAYVVDDAHDQVFEAVGEGADTVEASVGWTMTEGQEIETLRASGAAASSGVSLGGNAFANTLIGGSGRDTLDGGGGADRMYGHGGNDVYRVDDAHDRVFEAAGEGIDTVYASIGWTMTQGQEIETLRAFGLAAASGVRLGGNEFANTLIGGSGNDTLSGGLGNDRLTTGAGKDTVLFDTALGASNVDTVTDFSAADLIALDHRIFTGLALGLLNPSAFALGSATGAGPQIVYNRASGALSFDADGAASGQTQQFAILTGAPSLDSTRFHVV